MTAVVIVADAVVVVLAALAAIWFVGRRAKARLEQTQLGAEQEARRVLATAQQEAEQRIRDAGIEARERLLTARSEFERESHEYRQELLEIERRLDQREGALDERARSLDAQEKEFEDRKRQIEERESVVAMQEDALAAASAEQRAQLERIAGLTSDQAKAELMRRMENEARIDAAKIVRRIEEEANQEGNNRARRLISLAIQRLAAEHVVESTVSVVDLPNDEMKGRIIGREGRNIRALETATGVDLIVDDTPGAVLLSCFDPVRREVARLALSPPHVGRAHPPRAHRGGRRQGRRPSWTRRSSATAKPRRSSSANRISTPRSCACSGGCSSEPRTGRTCSRTRRKSRGSPGTWPPSSASTSASPRGRDSSTTSARRWTARWKGRTSPSAAIS